MNTGCTFSSSIKQSRLWNIRVEGNVAVQYVYALEKQVFIDKFQIPQFTKRSAVLKFREV
jgi:hypothetical protein